MFYVGDIYVSKIDVYFVIRVLSGLEKRLYKNFNALRKKQNLFNLIVLNIDLLFLMDVENI